MHRRLLSTALTGAALALVLVGAAAGGSAWTQTNWTILSATGTTLFTVDGTQPYQFADGTMGTEKFNANVKATWRQLPSKQPGRLALSIPLAQIPGYAPGKTLFWRFPLYGIAGSVTGTASVSSPERGSGSCKVAFSKLPRGFFTDSGANDLFLAAAKSGKDLLPFVLGQSAQGTISDSPSCRSGLPFGIPQSLDLKRERIKRVGSSLVKPTKKGKKVTLVILRTVPVTLGAGKATVGKVTEQAKITLRYDSGS